MASMDETELKAMRCALAKLIDVVRVICRDPSAEARERALEYANDAQRILLSEDTKASRPVPDPTLLAQRIDECALTVRTVNLLLKPRGYPGLSPVHPIETVGQLVQHTEAGLIVIPGFGSQALREVKEMLAAMGFSLAR
jgi:DNA-directed RNA polymerase alpha subunit